MKTGFKGMIKRGIAVGLMALMASVNPLQTLSPVSGAVAKAAETAAPYVGEVRLAVDDDAEDAKKILSDAGYEVIDQDLNEEAGSFWNKLGDQAVYMGIKRTDDENKAIRDMKTMNMCGKYSYSDLEQWVAGNRQTAKEKCAPLFTIRDEFKKNLKSGDLIAKKALEALNHIKETDSGMGVGDFLLSKECGEEGVIKVLVEGNGDLVSTIMELLYMGCETKNDTWLERLSVTTKKSLTKQYTKDLYGVENVIGEKKAEVEKRMASDLDETAHYILDNWDTMRDGLINKDKKVEFTPEEKELIEEDELLEFYTEFMSERNELVDSSLTRALKEIPYSGKTLLDFFTLDKKVFEKDITRLYPMAAAMSDGQRALIQYSSLSELANTALARAEARKTGDLKDSKLNEEKLYMDCPLYAGVDRAMFKEGAAMTSRATAEFAQSERNMIGVEYAFCASLMATIGMFALTLNTYTYAWDMGEMRNVMDNKIFNADMELFGDKYIKNMFKLPDNADTKSILEANYDVSNLDDLTDSVVIQDQSLYDEVTGNYQAKKAVAEREYASSLRSARIMLGITILLAIVTTTMYIISQREKHNRKQLAIPTVIVDRDVESTITGYVAYSCVLWNRDRNDDSGRGDRGDLNGDAGDQWLALYTTTDKAAGEPILADSIVAKTGNNGGEKTPGPDYVPLSLFGRESAQHLVDEAYSYNDEVGGIYIWYKKALRSNGADDLIDDTDKDDQAGESDTPTDPNAVSGSAADVTGSNIGGGTMAIGITGGAVGGFIIGMLCMYFYRKKRVIR